MPYGDWVIEQAKVYGLDLSTERLDPDGVFRADCCPPKYDGHWECTNMGWVHVPPSSGHRSIGDIWASANF